MEKKPKMGRRKLTGPDGMRALVLNIRKSRNPEQPVFSICEIYSDMSAPHTVDDIARVCGVSRNSVINLEKRSRESFKNAFLKSFPDAKLPENFLDDVRSEVNKGGAGAPHRLHIDDYGPEPTLDDDHDVLPLPDDIFDV